MCTVQINKMFTIAVIQPDVVADDKIDLILEKVNVFFSSFSIRIFTHIKKIQIGTSTFGTFYF